MLLRRTWWMVPILMAATAWAQEGSPNDRVTVPFSDPGRPKTVKANLLNGSISVHGYDGKDLLVEARGGSGKERRRPERARTDGLRRIDNNASGLEIEEENNVVKLSVQPWGSANVVLQVPRDTSLSIKLVNGGNLEVEGVRGEIDVDNLNGNINVYNVTGAVLAHSLNGSVKVTLDQVTAGKPMSFSSLNGEIDVTLPAATRANLKLKSDFGEIWSDFEMKVDSTPRAPVVETHNGKRRIKTEKNLYATINGGGPEIQFTTLNGRIYIRKGK